MTSAAVTFSVISSATVCAGLALLLYLASEMIVEALELALHLLIGKPRLQATDMWTLTRHHVTVTLLAWKHAQMATC